MDNYLFEKAIIISNGALHENTGFSKLTTETGRAPRSPWQATDIEKKNDLKRNAAGTYFTSCYRRREFNSRSFIKTITGTNQPIKLKRMKKKNESVNLLKIR